MRINRSWTPRWVGSAVIAFVLWILTSAAGLAEIAFFGEVVLWNLPRFRESSQALNAVLGKVQLKGSALVVIVLGVAWFGFAIWTGEYHYARYGHKSSWRLFAWTVGIEAVIGLLFWFAVLFLS